MASNIQVIFQINGVAVDFAREIANKKQEHATQTSQPNERTGESILQKPDYDVFICHADLDKQEVILPIVAACDRLGIKCWLDEYNIPWGDDVVERVGEGLQHSKFVLVVASENSVRRGWPLKEISIAMNDEISKGSVRVLPLFVGERESLVAKVPMLANKRSLTWDNNPDEIAGQLAGRLGREVPEKEADTMQVGPTTFLPKLKGQFNDQDRDRFVSHSFQDICDYFDKAGKHFEQSESRIPFEAQRPDNEKYRCTIYLDGNRKYQCQLWIYSTFGSRGINYFNGGSFAGEFSATNEMIRIDESTGDLLLNGSMGQHAGHTIKNAASQEAAEVLWKWFVSSLQHG